MPKYVCMADDFYTDEKFEVMDHLDTYPSHEIVEVTRNNLGEIETRLLKIESEKNLGP